MEKIRIQDDLYTYVNQAKLDELVIPEDMPIDEKMLSGVVENAQKAVFSTVEAMTGCAVTCVNIHVGGVTFD